MKKYFFLAFFGQKKKWEKGRFFDKKHGLTPLQNDDFLEFFRTFLLWSKKHSFLFFSMQNIKKCLFMAFFFQKKNIRVKGRFLDKNQTVHFFEFFRTSLFKFKKHSFLSRIWKNVSFWLFLVKKKIRKKSIFWQKPWTNPFAKCQFFRVFSNFSFVV